MLSNEDRLRVRRPTPRGQRPKARTVPYADLNVTPAYQSGPADLRGPLLSISGQGASVQRNCASALFYLFIYFVLATGLAGVLMGTPSPSLNRGGGLG